MLILVLLSASFIWYSDALQCTLYTSNITCLNIKEKDLYENMTATIDPDVVYDLNIMNASITSINRQIFSKYKQMQSLRIENSDLKDIANETFADLYNLEYLYLVNNSLTKMETDLFSENNTLEILDVSKNRIEDLSNFNFDKIPNLKVLNISNNKLHTLPQAFLNKIKENNELHLIIDNNPWNCKDTGWLNDNFILIKAFCNLNKWYPQIAAFHDSTDEETTIKSIDTYSEHHDKSGFICAYESRCFSYCVFWFIGGIWLGVILGNVCKIKSLLCTTNITFMQEQDTQCERSQLREKESPKK